MVLMVKWESHCTELQMAIGPLMALQITGDSDQGLEKLLAPIPDLEEASPISWGESG